MLFTRDYYYEDELKGSVTNRMKMSIAEAGKLPLLSEPLFFCDRCDFPLLQSHCVFCHFENPEKPLGAIMEQELRNFRFQQKAERTSFGSKPLKGKKSCYILCIDISGSTVTSYLAPEGYRTPTIQHIINELGKEAYINLKLYIPEQDILKYMEYFRNLYSVGLSHADIISEYRRENGKSYGGRFGNRKAEVYVNRKQLIQQGVTKFVELLVANDPEALVYVVYFNNNVVVPRANFDGYQTISDTDTKFPDEMYELGRQYAASINIPPIKDSAAKLLNSLVGTPNEGQTALGPALVFCYGIASELGLPLHQINIITDGSSNVGFGETQTEDSNTKQLYEKITLRYGVNNSCMVNLIGFSDEKIGFDKLSEVIFKTNGLAFLVDIVQNEKSQRSVSVPSLEKYLNEFKIYIDRARNCLTDFRASLVVDNADIMLKVEPSDMSYLAHNEYPNCIDLALGLSNQNRTFGVLFEGGMEEKNAPLKFSLVFDFVFNGVRNTLVTERFIEVRKGTKQLAQQQMLKGLQEEIRCLRFNHNAGVEEYKSMKDMMERNPKVVKEDQMELITKELQRLEIMEKKREATIGKDGTTIRRARRAADYDQA